MSQSWESSLDKWFEFTCNFVPSICIDDDKEQRKHVFSCFVCCIHQAYIVSIVFQEVLLPWFLVDVEWFLLKLFGNYLVRIEFPMLVESSLLGLCKSSWSLSSPPSQILLALKKNFCAECCRSHSFIFCCRFTWSIQLSLCFVAAMYIWFAMHLSLGKNAVFNTSGFLVVCANISLTTKSFSKSLIVWTSDTPEGK